MARVIQRRLLYTVLVVWGVATVLFFVMQLSGDPVVLLLPEDATFEERQTLRQHMGLDQPLPVQYVRFLGDLVQLNFGRSFSSKIPAFDAVLSKLPNTIQLAIAAQIVAVVVGIPVGVYAATRRRSPLSFLALLGSLLGQAIPNFWFGVLLIMLFAVWLRVLPTSGMGGPQHFILPVITLSTALMPSLVRLSRSGMLEVLSQDYIRTARAKGLNENRVVYGHALKNMLIPVVTVIALEFAQLLGGAVVVETVFGWDGIGQQLVRAVLVSDYPVVQATVFVVALMVVVINLVLDLVYLWLDPRIRVD